LIVAAELETTIGSVNQLTLTASIAEISAQRYTPAGIPAIDLTLEHQSEQIEAGQIRKVKVSVRTVAIGPMAEAIRTRAIGSTHSFTGFLGSARNAKGTLFHIQAFEPH
jgi:primosomal replication protein N